MKAVMVVVAMVLGLALVAPAFAQSSQSTDYSKMSNDELYQLKKSGNVPPQQEPNLEEEWINRVIKMTPQERQKYNLRYSDEEIQKMRMQRQAPR